MIILSFIVIMERTFMVLVALFIIIFIILYKTDTGGKKFMGKDIWHTPKKIWTYDYKGIDNNRQLFDYYSFLHIFHGIFFYYFLYHYVFNKQKSLKLVIFVLLLEFIFEMVENSDFVIERLRKTNILNYYRGDSVINILGDMFMALIGLIICWYMDINS